MVTKCSFASSLIDFNQEMFNLLAYKNSISLPEIKKYLNSGADPNFYPSVDNLGKNTSLSMYISTSGFMIERGILDELEANEVLKLFFEKGAKLRNTDYRLIHAHAPQQNLYIQTLLANGFDPTIFVEGLSFIDRIVQKNNKLGLSLILSMGYKQPSNKRILELQFFDAIADYDTVRVGHYLKQGVDIDAINEDGKTALITLLAYPLLNEAQHQTIGYLIDKKADLNKASQGSVRVATATRYLEKAQPLHVAVQSTSFLIGRKKRGNERYQEFAKTIIKRLIDAGAAVSGRTANDLTPLHLAAEEDNVFAAKLLLKNHAKVIPQDFEGKTPLDYAESPEMISLLKKYGAKEK